MKVCIICNVYQLIFKAKISVSYLKWKYSFRTALVLVSHIDCNIRKLNTLTVKMLQVNEMDGWHFKIEEWSASSTKSIIFFTIFILLLLSFNFELLDCHAQMFFICDALRQMVGTVMWLDKQDQCIHFFNMVPWYQWEKLEKQIKRIHFFIRKALTLSFICTISNLKHGLIALFRLGHWNSVPIKVRKERLSPSLSLSSGRLANICPADTLSST